MALPRDNKTVPDQNELQVMAENFNAALQVAGKDQLISLLNPNVLPEVNKIFITIGPGKQVDQIRTHLYEVERRRDSVLHLVIDTDIDFTANDLAPDYEFSKIVDIDQRRECANVLKNKFKLFSVSLPFDKINKKSVDNLLQIQKFDPNFRIDWKTELEAQSFRDKWKACLTACVKQGKEIILGYHIDHAPSGFFLEAYNELKKQYPDRIFMLMAHESEDTVVPLYTIDQKQINEMQKNVGSHEHNKKMDPTYKERVKHIFKFIPYNGEKRLTGLSSPELTLDNLKKWTHEAVNAQNVSATATAYVSDSAMTAVSASYAPKMNDTKSAHGGSSAHQFFNARALVDAQTAVTGSLHVTQEQKLKIQRQKIEASIKLIQPNFLNTTRSVLELQQQLVSLKNESEQCSRFMTQISRTMHNKHEQIKTIKNDAKKIGSIQAEIKSLQSQFKAGVDKYKNQDIQIKKLNQQILELDAKNKPEGLKLKALLQQLEDLKRLEVRAASDIKKRL